MLTNLPADATSFVGRRAEIAEVNRRLSRPGPVTLTGVGGVGKTRLALHVARHVRRAFGDGVWLVALAEVRDPQLLVLTVMDALGVRGEGTDPTDSLVAYLGDKHLLLILDNCEHLLAACASLVNRLLSQCPKVQALATSREPLGIDGERTVVVPPLAVPDDGQSGEPGAGNGRDAVTLFAERAQAVLPGFAVTDRNRETVVSLCRRLDGLPLAIELAAVRMRALSVEEILARLDDRYALLARGRRAVTPRHESLRAAVDWSFELCSPQEQVTWARLSVFSGGVDPAAAEAVCSGNGISRAAVRASVAGLVDKSILVPQDIPEDVTGRTRYRWLETIREYGHERLGERGEEAALRRRHRDYYLGLAEEAEARWFGPDQVALFTHLRAEHANLRSALEFCLSEPDHGREPGHGHAGLRMAGALWIYWLVRGLPREGRHWLGRALAQDPGPSPRRAAALWADGFLAALLGRRSVALGRLDECRAMSRRQGDRAVLAHATYTAGYAHLIANELGPAVAKLEEGARMERELDGPDSHRGIAEPLRALAAFLTGRTDTAIALLRECRARCEAHHERWALSWVLTWLGLAVWAGGHPRQATAHLREAVGHKHALGDLLGLASAVEYLAWIAVAVGDHERGARLLGVARQLFEPLGGPVWAGPRARVSHNKSVRRATDALGARSYEEIFRSGTKLTREQVVAYADGGARPTAAASSGTRVLTRREAQVAELLARGMSNKEIADRLVISRRTAEVHVARVLAKLGLTSRTHVATWAEQQRAADERPPGSREG